VSGEVWLDGRRRGEPLGKPVSDALRDTLGPDQRRPSATSFTPGAVLPTDYDAFLLSVKPYDPATDGQFVDLIGRLRIVLVYASLHGEQSTVDWARDSDAPET
jgi:hypothetical protein